MDRIKKNISLFLAVLTLVMALPIGEFVVLAEELRVESTAIEVNKVEVQEEIYKNDISRNKKVLVIEGKNLIKDGKRVINVFQGVNATPLTPAYQDEGVITYDLQQSNATSIAIRGEGISGFEGISILPKNPPIIRGIEERIVDEGTKYYLIGDNLNSEGYTISVGITEINVVNGTPNEIDITEKLKAAGPVVITVKGKEKDSNEKVLYSREYHDYFYKYNELKFNGDPYPNPNIGKLDQIIDIVGTDPQTGELSLFFTKELNEPLNLNKKAEFVSTSKINGRQVHTFKVPKSLEKEYKNNGGHLGEYYLIMTNRADKIENISERIILKEKFRLVAAEDGLRLTNIIDDYGSTAGGKEVTVFGHNIATLSGGSHKPEKDDYLKNLRFPDNGKKLILEDEGGSYDGKKYESLTREIEVTIGGQAAKFKEDGHNLISESATGVKNPEELKILTPSISDDEELTQPVAINIITTIQYEEENKEIKQVIIRENDILGKKFKYSPRGYEPEIINVVPDPLVVNYPAGEVQPSNLNMVITGREFFVHRFKKTEKTKKPDETDGDEGEDGKETDKNTQENTSQYITKYPVIYLGDNLLINPNDPKNELEFEILNENGKPVTGETNNNKGVKMRISLSKAIVPKADIDKASTLLTIYNPSNDNIEVDIKDKNKKEGLSTDRPASYELGVIREDQVKLKPVIDSLKPNRLSTEGYKGAEILGSGFSNEVKVFIDGEEIQNVKRDPENDKKINFDLPAKPEGKYQIVIQNADTGGLAVTEVIYVKSYTSIKIDDFNPKKGSKDTLVKVSGSGFVKGSDVKVDSIEGLGLDKLIGTVVLLDGRDVNEYNYKNGKIALQEVEPGNILSVEGSKLIVDDSHCSFVFKHENDEDEDFLGYYTIHYDSKDGEYYFSDGSTDKYRLKAKDGKLVGEKGKDYKINIDGSILTLKSEPEEIKFKIKTPFKLDNDKVVGHRAKVINNNEIIFNVPGGLTEGWKDLTLMNPDTNRDSRTGEAGFYYFRRPKYDPEIHSIKPNEGSTTGGYYIEIEAKDAGKGFVHAGGEKTQVIIDGIKVPDEDVRVLPGNKVLKVRVPAYPGDLDKETSIGRKTVPVTVVNPDGGSDSLEKGFTYVKPTSNPRIVNIFEKSGQATGGNEVTLEATDMRFFEPYKNIKPNEENKAEYTDLNNNDSWEDLLEEFPQGLAKKDYVESGEKSWEKYIYPILPKVFFGEKEAEIISFDRDSLELIVPAGTDGDVDVYLLNNDYGKSPIYKYRYNETSPVITDLNPRHGGIDGGYPVNILGRDFKKSEMRIIENKTTVKNKEMHQVQFGDIEDENTSNQKFKPGNMDEEGRDNSGRIRSGKAEVKVGDLAVNYTIANGKETLVFQAVRGRGENRKVYEFEYDWDGKEVYLPMDLLKNVDEEAEEKDSYYPARELVKISKELLQDAENTYRIRVDRGFSKNVREEANDYLIAEASSYYAVKDTKIVVINPDKNKAEENFKYERPTEGPVITNLKRGSNSPVEETIGTNKYKVISVPYTGGSKVFVEGIRFTEPAEIVIGGKNVVKDLEYHLDDAPQSVSFTMPKLSEKDVGKYMRVTINNLAGGMGTHTSDELRIRITRPLTLNLAVDGIIPNTGPTKGGTEVTIHGKDFVNKLDDFPGSRLRVYFQRGNEIKEVPESDILSVSDDKIVLKTPAFSAGSVNVIIENPDNNSVTLLDGFTYTTDPKITSVVDPEDDKLVINTISFEGGERIKLKGSDFMDGLRVIFNPVLEELADDETEANITGGELVVINGKRYVLKSGVEGTELEYIDGQNILITTPAGKLGDKGVLVINPDGGVSNVYNLEYGIPEVGAPFNVRAELVHDEFIRVTWNGVRNATEYEIYVSENGGAFEFIGSTQGTSFAYQKIKPNTNYQFMVRAIGKYGQSKPIDESKSNRVRTGSVAGPEDTDGGLGENTIISKEGDTVNVSLGSKDYNGEGMTIDLTRGELAGAKNIVVRMPAKLVSSQYQKEIRVIGKDFGMSFNPYVFRNDNMIKNQSRSDAGIVFELKEYKGPADASNRITAGPKYELKAASYLGKNRTEVSKLNGGINFRIDENQALVKNRRLKSVKLSRYYPGNKIWVDTEKADRMAIYTVTGSRR